MYNNKRYQQTFVKKYFYLEISGKGVTLLKIITHMADTALQKAIHQIRNEPTDFNYKDDATLTVENVLDILTSLLPYERETIEAAYSDGVNDEAFGRLLGSVAYNSQDYFTKTYQND
jgi:hypothetical protein